MSIYCIALFSSLSYLDFSSFTKRDFFKSISDWLGSPQVNTGVSILKDLPDDSNMQPGFKTCTVYWHKIHKFSTPYFFLSYTENSKDFLSSWKSKLMVSLCISTWAYQHTILPNWFAQRMCQICLHLFPMLRNVGLN